MAFELTGSAGIALLVARVLVGGVLAFMGVNHFMNTEDMAGYAQMKGVPAPTLAVTFSSASIRNPIAAHSTSSVPIIASDRRSSTACSRRRSTARISSGFSW